MTLESILLITLALGIGALVKGATGMGLPLIALPVLASFFGVPHAIAILTIPIIVTNFWQVWQFRDSTKGTAFLTPMLVAGAVGIIGGTWLLANLPAKALSFGLGVLLVLYIVLRVTRPTVSLSAEIGRKVAPFVGLTAGTLQGATGLASPIGIPFVHALRLDRDAHVFAVSAMFLLFSSVQIIAMWIADLLTWRYLIEGFIALVPVAVIMPLGGFLGRAMSQKTFDLIILALLAVIAINLVYSSIA